MSTQVGDVVRLRIENWADGLLMIVEEVRSWGVIGVIPTPQGEAPLRVKFDDITAVWRPVANA
jgi:hypothetical protein